MSLEVTYKGSQIAQLTEDGNLTLETAGKYCEGDIGLAYSGGGGGTELVSFETTQNGVFNAPAGKGYSPVKVDVFQVQTYALALDGIFGVSSPLSSYGIDPSTIPKKISIDAPNCFSLLSAFSQSAIYDTFTLGTEEVSLTLYHPVFCRNMFFRNQSIKRVTFPRGLEVSNMAISLNSFLNGSVIEEIIGDIKIQPGSSNYSGAFNCATLKEIRFVADTLDLANLVFTSSVLSDASLVSIANGLDPNASGCTLTHDATAKARCTVLMGTVSSGVFTADAQGSTTLSDFITNTKGWTLA